MPSSLCLNSDYGVYRGNLPWVGYNHASITCNAGGTSYTTPADSGSYYFLIAAQNTTSEGSYGTDSSSSQRPPASLACLPQNIGNCNIF